MAPKQLNTRARISLPPSLERWERALKRALMASTIAMISEPKAKVPRWNLKGKYNPTLCFRATHYQRQEKKLINPAQVPCSHMYKSHNCEAWNTFFIHGPVPSGKCSRQNHL